MSAAQVSMSFGVTSEPITRASWIRPSRPTTRCTLTYVKVARECRVVRLRFSCRHYDHMRATELQRICYSRKTVEVSEPQREDGVRTRWRHLTVKLRGRIEAPTKRRGRTLSPGARGAKQTP